MSRRYLVSLLPSPEQVAIRAESQQKLAQVLDTLTYLEREVLKLRYGLGDGYSYTLEQWGRILGLHPLFLRNLEHRALRRLQHPARLKLLSAIWP